MDNSVVFSIPITITISVGSPQIQLSQEKEFEKIKKNFQGQLSKKLDDILKANRNASFSN